MGQPPAITPAHLVHGDYHCGNLIVRDGAVVAVLDWEIAHLGVTASDKASLCMLAARSTKGAEMERVTCSMDPATSSPASSIVATIPPRARP